MSSKIAPTPGCSHYAEGTPGGGWYFNAWLRRRSLKIGTTSQMQDLVRCYEAMTPGMYQDNLAVKEHSKSLNFWAHRGFPLRLAGVVDPTSYEHLLLPRRTSKRMARGSLRVGRKRMSVTGTRKLKRNDSAMSKESSSKQNAPTLGCGGQISESNHDRGNGSENSQFLNTAILGKPARKPVKHVRFDEDSDWIDICNEDVPDQYEEEECGIFCTMGEDEYILL